jgi:selenocysteine lyase/cysteine desulfurase
MDPQDVPLERLDRRDFLKGLGGVAGLATLFGADSLRAIEAAVRDAADLTPQESAREEALWGTVQQAFTMSRSLINLDNGWTSPSPRVVTEALVQYIWEQEHVPVQEWITEFRTRLDTVRIALADLFGVSPDEVAIVRNATEALNTVLFGIPLKAGDEVLASSQDYGTMVSTLRSRQTSEGIVLTQVDLPSPPQSPDEVVERFRKAITPKTRLILVSHIGYLNGLIFPVRKICDLAHQQGIEVVVDGAHSFGHLAFKQSDLGCDYYGTSLHKWLHAPKGTGLLYIRKDSIAKVPPLITSASQRRMGSMRKFESVGTQSYAPLLAIGEAIAFQNTIGAKRKEERLRYLAHYWAERLQKTPRIRLYSALSPEMSCGILTVGIDGVPGYALDKYLWEMHRIRTADIVREFPNEGDMNGLRITPNLYTTLKELDRFCEVMEYVAANGLPEPYASMKPPQRQI